MSSWIVAPEAGARSDQWKNRHDPATTPLVVVAVRPPPAAHPGCRQDDTRGRSPGSRVLVLARLPGAEPQWHSDKSSPVTVAGAAAALHRVPLYPLREPHAHVYA